MKILWLHQYFSTPKGWGAVRTYEFARRFCAEGHTVDVVCCAGYDSSLEDSGYLSGGRVIDGILVHISRTTYRPHMGFVRRVLSFLSFMSYALRFVAKSGKQFDVIIASSGPLTLALPALVGRWLYHVPYVFEVIDVWPDSAIAAGVLQNPVLKWLSFRLEALAYKDASAVVTCSTGMTERVERKVLNKKVVTISNCCDLEPFVADAERRRRTRGSFGVTEGQMVVLYTGAMGLSNAVEDLVAAVKQTADDERIVWWFAGDGGRSELLRECVSTLVGGEGDASRRGHWFGVMPKEQLVELYLAADVNVITFMHEPLFHENSPNKFFDGIAAELPALFNRSTWLEPWLEKYGCGVVCRNEDAGTEMSQQLKLLASESERRRRMGQGARRLAAEVFDRNLLSKMYLDVLEGTFSRESSRMVDGSPLSCQ